MLGSAPLDRNSPAHSSSGREVRLGANTRKCSGSQHLLSLSITKSTNSDIKAIGTELRRPQVPVAPCTATQRASPSAGTHKSKQRGGEKTRSRQQTTEATCL